MRWEIPGKTFLLGEYAALEHQSAILITTTPCFIIEKTTDKRLYGIHPDSPAGKYWKSSADECYGLRFHDPLQSLGGLGASSAQFVGAWLAHNADRQMTNAALQRSILHDYWRCAWNGRGKRPSGYDVLAQLMHQCVHIHFKKNIQTMLPWRFDTLGVLLVHTGNKLATHVHLQEASVPEPCIDQLSVCADLGAKAIALSDERGLIEAVKEARSILQRYQLVSAHSQALLKTLETIPQVRALKGCGAMGADIIALLVDNEAMEDVMAEIQKIGAIIIASHQLIFDKS